MDIKRLSKGKIEEGVVRDNTVNNRIKGDRIKAQPIFLKTLPTFLQSRAGVFVIVFVLSVFIFQIISLSFFDIKNAEAQSTNQTNTSQITGSQSGLTYSQAFRKELDDLITKSGKPSFSIYTSTDTSLQGQFQINQNSWTSSLDFSGVSNWNDFSWNRRAGTLVTPQFMVLATHHQLEIGATVSFTDRQGKIEKRKITDIRYIGGGSDIEVAKLDSPLPEDRFKVYPIFDYQEFMKNVAINDEFSNFNFEPYLTPQDTYATPDTPIYIGLNQYRSVLLGYMRMPYTLSGNEQVAQKTIEGLDPRQHSNAPSNYLDATIPGIVRGDSGSPSFLVFNGQLVLLKTHTTPGSGPFYSYYKNDIETAISNMGSTDKLRIAHLTGYRPDNHEPYFDQADKGKMFSINEHSPEGTIVGKVRAYDVDAGQSITYRIVGGTGKDIFKINSVSGEISVANSYALDYEAITDPNMKALTLEIEAADNGAPVKKTFLTQARNYKSFIKVLVIDKIDSAIPRPGVSSFTVDAMDTFKVKGGVPFHVTYTAKNWSYDKNVYVYLIRYNTLGKRVQGMLISRFEIDSKDESATLEVNIPDYVLKTNNAALGEGDYYKLLFVDLTGGTTAQLDSIINNGVSTNGVFGFSNLFSVRYTAGSVLGDFKPVQPAFSGLTTNTDIVTPATTTITNLIAIGGTNQTIYDENGYDKTLCGISFSKNLTIGATGIDVFNLQKYLLSKKYMDAVSGVPSYYFGNLTKTALSAFQKIKAISPALGYFGPLTRNTVNELIKSDCNAHGDSVVQTITATTSNPIIETAAPVKKIEITYPIGNEVFEQGKQYRIGWTTQNMPVGSLVNIYKVVGSEDIKIAENIAVSIGSSNSYYWTPQASDIGTMKIKVVSQTSSKIVSVSPNYFSVVAPQERNTSTVISISAPATGETWYRGDVKNISWSAGNLSAWGQGGRIEISNNEHTYIITRDALRTATVSGNTASFRYSTVGSTEKTASQDEKISAGEYNVSVCSPFGACGTTGKINIADKIVDLSTLDPWVAVAPIGDVSVGQTKRISWETNDKVKNVTISLLSADKRSFGLFLAQNIPNTEYYDWVIADPATAQTDFVISVRGGNNLNSAEASFTDYSDATFKIGNRVIPGSGTNSSTTTVQTTSQPASQTMPSVTVLSPSTNDSLIEGSKYTIRFEALHSDSVDIRLAGPTGTQDIVYSAPNTGSFEWTVSRMGNSPTTNMVYAIAVRGKNQYGTSYAAGGNFAILAPSTSTTTARISNPALPTQAASIQQAIQNGLLEYFQKLFKAGW